MITTGGFNCWWESQASIRQQVFLCRRDKKMTELRKNFLTIRRLYPSPVFEKLRSRRKGHKFFMTCYFQIFTCLSPKPRSASVVIPILRSSCVVSKLQKKRAMSKKGHHLFESKLQGPLKKVGTGPPNVFIRAWTHLLITVCFGFRCRRS